MSYYVKINGSKKKPKIKVVKASGDTVQIKGLKPGQTLFVQYRFVNGQAMSNTSAWVKKKIK